MPNGYYLSGKDESDDDFNFDMELPKEVKEDEIVQEELFRPSSLGSPKRVKR